MSAVRRWARKSSEIQTAPSGPVDLEPPPTVPLSMKAAYQDRARAPSYIVQHYHSTGCAGGAFSWRAAMLDPKQPLTLCTERREYRSTTAADIQVSKDDKRRGGGPRVGPFQTCIPGEAWMALPKYDMNTKCRSSAFNERMHVEWENHVDHILANNGQLPVASVVAKAGYRSCSPCCRDMLALARPTGKTFIMVDLADDDRRGTFHFVTGDKYLPVPKELLDTQQLAAMKKVVSDAQNNLYTSSEAIYNAVLGSGVPIDEQAQEMYLGDSALMPARSAETLKGAELLKVLHAEHFARLTAEYGASILRDSNRSQKEIRAVLECRSLAKQMLVEAWKPILSGPALQRLDAYADAAVRPLLPENNREYTQLKLASAATMKLSRHAQQLKILAKLQPGLKEPLDIDAMSVAEASTAVPDDESEASLSEENCF